MHSTANFSPTLQTASPKSLSQDIESVPAIGPCSICLVYPNGNVIVCDSEATEATRMPVKS